MSDTGDQVEIRKTPLYDLHVRLGARMVPFAGYAMPVQYPAGILKEHAATRTGAGLFDVSHMGQAFLDGLDGRDVAATLEEILPGDLRGLTPGRQKYSLLMNDAGGIEDDLMVTRVVPELGDNRLYLVVNAGCKETDFPRIAAALEGKARLTRLEDRALLALQGPEAAAVLDRFAPGVAALEFMEAGVFTILGQSCYVSRSGYTGEDGFEISIPNSGAVALAEALLGEPEVEPIGLGARDSLRLEAGLCLYGHDLDPATSPVEAGLMWAIPKRRREEANFPGAARVLSELASGPSRRRVGLKPEGRIPAREGAEIVDADGQVIGLVTSGGFGPSVNGPIAMGYVAPAHVAVGTRVGLLVRGKAIPAEVVALPFVAPRYVRKAKI
ncbi:glycine cleavage system aminomethyltransferase GcvT [Govanella unica]|uniref:aminomethyltransferase n=1 Tax=Govanella unica TaxID=2975056 RepID=A0A9X3Z6Q2_9PROT|nr:glycine cleavage system aminomethyltransferase GcvT [Govania unica]MDA5193366.1 glycine cleavage system aminomethyltransferase GcvT [Govania unica]